MKISDLTPLQEKQLRAYCSYLEMKNEKIERKKEENIESARNDFKTFVKLLFPHSVAQRPFEESQHTEVLIKIIQYLVDKKLLNKKVVISIPPGHTKTLICNVLASAWILGKSAYLRMLLGQCSQTEANKRNLELREIMSYKFYKQIFPDSYLTGTDVKWLKTNKQGGRLAVTTDPAMRFTGTDGDLLIMDDPNDSTSTKLDLEKVIDWYEKKAKRRLRKGNMGFVCIQQRVDPNDLTGHILSKQSDVLHILLKAESEEDYTISIPLIDGTFDNILIKKGYLWNDTEMIKMYQEAKTNQKTWETQYQQNPQIYSENALWTFEMVENTKQHNFYSYSVDQLRQLLDKIFIGVDPAMSNNKNSDETGIIVAGFSSSMQRYIVLEDGSGKYSPEAWASKVNSLYDKWKANYIMVEKNQGGDMILDLLHRHNRILPVTLIHATYGKFSRAEPIAMLYEKGLVYHMNGLEKLENQLMYFDPKNSTHSPDRMDAMVYAIQELARKVSTFG